MHPLGSGEEIEAPTHTKFLGTTIGKPASGEVLKSEADTAEYRHLLIIAPTRSGSGKYLAEFGMDSIGRQTSTAHSPHCDGKRAIVHHDASGEQRVGRNFALAGLVGAESRDVHSGSQMPAKQERLLSPGRRDDDVSAVEGFIEIAGQSDFKTPTSEIVGKTPARFWNVIKHTNGRQRAYATQGRELRLPLRARADDRDGARSGSREDIGSQCTDQPGAQRGQIAALHDRQRDAGSEVVKHQEPPDRRIASGKLGMHLDRIGGDAVDYPRCEQHPRRARRHLSGRQRHWYPHRVDPPVGKVGRECFAKRVQQSRRIEQLDDLGAGKQ